MLQCLLTYARRWGSVFASPWATLIGRVLLVAAALVVFALIGRTTLAHDPPPNPISSSPSPVSPESPPAGHPADAGGSSVCVLAQTSSAPSPATSSGTDANSKITLNIATAEELRRLPGIGPKRAAAVVELRTRLGRFKRVDDLLRIKGIGRRLLNRIRPLVRLDLPPENDAGL